MIDFCVEPEKHCHRDPIGELDLKVDQYYSSIYSRLCKHINDTVVHITQEERDGWNNKASKEALKDIQDQLNEITGDGSGSIKQEILLEVTKLIASAIADLNLGDYAKKKYVDDAIKSIKLDGYVTKDYADSTYLKIVDYTKFDADSYYTKAEINNMLKNSDIAKDYSISEFTIKDNKLILVQKNGGKFEVALSGSGSGNGVDVNYVQDQLKNYIRKGTLSRLIINDIYYSIEDGGDIKIPVGGGGSDIDPTKYGYYKSYFKETSNKVTSVTKPADNRPPEEGSGWLENAPNYREGYLVWMTQVFINGNGQYGEYINPICLTGNGTAGEDGSGVNFIYKTFINEEQVSSPGVVTVKNGVPVVPEGWTDHPKGVTKDVPYEYCSVAINTKGQWSPQWSQPFVWSHFGQNGMDGDGVEYIYYASLVAPTHNLPETWTNDEGFQNNEYIREGSEWTDDPQDLEKKGPGYKQWVCVRKKYADAGSENVYWHAYSSPALWSYYSKDGIASALIMDIVGENKYLYLTQDNKNKRFESSSMAYMYNDGDPIDFTLSIGSFTDSAGNDYSSVKDQYFTIEGNQVNIDIPENTLSFDNDIYYKIVLVGTPTSTSVSSQVRQAEIQLFGLVRGADGKPGDNAVSYDIKTSASAINLQDGTMYPNLISVYVAKSDGSQITNITPSNSSDWQFSYSINDGDSWNTISTDQIQTEGESGMLFKATNGTIILSEYVPIVKSGIDGLNGVTYQLQLSNISLSYAPAEGQDYNLQMSCNVNLYKNESSVGDRDADIKMQLNSNDKTKLQYSSDHWVATVNATVQSKSSVITIYAYNKNGAYLTSVTVPVSSSGKKGDPGQSSTGQALKGSPLRIVGDFDNSKTYYDGKRAVDDADGVMYQDVVRYNNMYYACVNYDTWESEKGSTQNPEKSTAFEPFRISDNTFYDLLIANKANIREISSEEVVIFEGNGNSQGDIVAGMTSGKGVTSDSYLNGKVKDKGDVRIWAGKMTSKGDLTSAPFTVTDAGVLKCKSDKGNSIELKDGTIWFVIDGQTYHLGITNGKPDWINANGPDSQMTVESISQNGSTFSETQMPIYSKNGLWYSDIQCENLLDGDFYIYQGLSNIFTTDDNNYIIAGINNVKIFRQITVDNGTISYNGICGFGKKVSITKSASDGYIYSASNVEYVWYIPSSKNVSTSNTTFGYPTTNSVTEAYKTITLTTDVGFDTTESTSTVYYLEQSSYPSVGEDGYSTCDIYYGTDNLINPSPNDINNVYSYEFNN